MLTKRFCTEADREFVYNLLKENLADYFKRNTEEGWSDEKFHQGFNSEKITILELADKSIGFYDVEQIDGETPYLYLHNLQIKKGERGHPVTLSKLLDEEAKIKGLKLIKAKVFKDNIRTIRLAELMGYSVLHDKNLEEQENSVYIQKELS